jgi:hypothetical protein
MKYTFTILFTFCAVLLFAQLEKTVHQTFNVTDAQNIMMKMNTTYELKTWPGDAVLVETNIKLENATNAILNFVVESGRYEIVLEDQGNGANFNLKEKNTKRAQLTTKNGIVNESVSIKIFVPEFFDIGDPALLRRKE